MKPPKFQYCAPTSLDEATALLHQHGVDAKVLAGGQSLMPLLNMRLVRPQVVIDVNRVSGLQYVSPAPGGCLAVGALTRQRELERSDLVRETAPLLAAALPFIGHFPTRNRGTVGGSMVHADPAAELPAVSVALGAEFVLTRAQGQRRFPRPTSSSTISPPPWSPTNCSPKFVGPPWMVAGGGDSRRSAAARAISPWSAPPPC